MRRFILPLMLLLWLIPMGGVMAAPAPDAAEQVYPCSNSPATRLAIGATGRVTPGLANNLRESPSLTARRVGRIPAGGTFTVLFGPQCGNNLTWWQVNYNGVIGWTAEGQGGSYWLEPVAGNPTPVPVSCPGAPTPRLTANTMARVTPGAPNTLRSGPGTNYNRLSSIPGGASLTVLGGPTCANGFQWWQVSYAGITGWTAEGQGSTYWLEPLACPGAPASRLVVGGRGRVTPGLPNTVREGPATSSRYVGQIPAGGVFTVVAGPQCGGNILWWYVNYNGLTGWTGEGSNNAYWLEPVQ